MPTTTPLAELLPGVVALGVGPGSGPDDVRPWRLSRPVGPDLDLERTLLESGIGDGDLLLLRHEGAPVLGLLRSDPVVVLAGVVDGRPGRWTPERRTVLGLALLVPLLVGLLVVSDVASGPVTTGVLAAVGVAVLLLAAGASVPEPRVATALAVLALLPAAALGRAVGDGLGAGVPATLAWVSAALLAGTLLTAGVAPARNVALGIGTVAVGATVASAVGASGFGPVRAAAVGLVASIAALPFLPRLALRAAGIVRTGSRAGSSATARGQVGAADAARTTLTALLASLVPLVAVQAAVVAFLGGVSGRWLALAAAAALLLRARAALFSGEVIALVLAGTAAAVSGVAADVLAVLPDGPAAAAVLPPAGLCLVALALALPATRAAVSAPGADRRLRQLEAVALLALVPLALAVLGVFGLVADAASGLR